jgi:hypothetical protein
MSQKLVNEFSEEYEEKFQQMVHYLFKETDSSIQEIFGCNMTKELLAKHIMNHLIDLKRRADEAEKAGKCDELSHPD